MSLVSMHFIIDLLLSNKFYNIFVVVDLLTKKACFYFCRKSPSRDNTTRLFHDYVYCYRGLPNNIVSFQGT